MTTSEKRTAWDAAIDIIERLRAGGHVALLAGGCVRDRLLNRVPKDYDVATDAPPDRVAEIFPRVRQVGAKFGVVLVRRYGYDIEVATFRADGTYSDGRHPDSVTFGSAEEDANRRDFTVNGLFLDPSTDEVIDYVGGRADLSAAILRTIGSADRRFAEDHLRMLRAVRFASRFNFDIERATRDAIQEHAAKLVEISPERVWMELELILSEPTRAEGWSLLVETGLHAHLAPAWTVSSGGGAELVIRRLAALPPTVISPGLAMAAALCDLTASAVEQVCRHLRLSNQLAKSVLWLLRSLARAHRPEQLELADLKILMAESDWKNLVALLHADLSARGSELAAYTTLVERAAEVAAEDVAPPPLLTGDDLQEMGHRPGPELGRILKAIYRAQLNEEINSRGEAEELARRLSS